MYIYMLQAMPGYKALFEGDTSVQYRVRRKHTTAPANAPANNRSRIDDIRTDLDYTEATAMVKRFNDKERESRAMKS